MKPMMFHIAGTICFDKGQVILLINLAYLLVMNRAHFNSTKHNEYGVAEWLWISILMASLLSMKILVGLLLGNGYFLF